VTRTLLWDGKDNYKGNQAVDDCIHGPKNDQRQDVGTVWRPISNAAAMPGSSKDAHALVPSLIDGIARKIIEMDAPIANAMISLALIVRIIDTPSF
jgi:hypothetical protein